MTKLINKTLIGIIMLIINYQTAYSAIYKPATTNITNWELNGTWLDENNNPTSLFPVSGDEVEFGASGLTISSGVSISGITFTANEWGSVLTINGTVTNATINQASQQVILTVNSGGTLETASGLNMTEFGSTLNVYGVLTVNGDLNFEHPNNHPIKYLNSSGSLTITGDLIVEGVDINITGGKTLVNGKWIINTNHSNGSNTLKISEGAEMEVEGGSYFDVDDPFNFDSGSIISVEGNYIGKCTDTSKASSVCDTLSNLTEESLPVTLLAFNGEKVGDDFLLTWTTASEQNSDRFEIEASNDKRSWEVIGKVDAQGNSDTKYEYSFLNTRVQFLYYRLAQYDLDGSVEYFGVVYSESQSSQINILVFPSLLEKGEEVKVFFSGVSEGNKVKLLFMDLQGVVLINEYFNDISDSRNFIKVKIPNLANNGIYILHLSVNGKVFRNKLLIK